MTKKSRSLSSLPPSVTGAVLHLGEHIRIARKRRELTLDAMASRMFVTRKTLSRLENGDPGISLGVLASALWVLGFEKDLLEIAHPEKDKVGIYRDRQRLPKRVRPSRTKHDLDF
ncbi:MAG: helix-turn-helix domain-containing protein [Deltaproteobacteria bacterium]|nr:helix-turn-helix domain-containing protein [Deltaproteobacteria bacterium]